MGTAPYTPGGLSNSKLKLATATKSDVASGKTFFSGDKAVKTGTWVPTLKLIKEGSVTVMSVAKISLTVSGYSEYYCFHSDGAHSSLSWSASQGSFDGYTWTGNGYYKKLKGCNPNSSVTIGTVYNHDTGGYARYLKIFAIE